MADVGKIESLLRPASLIDLERLLIGKRLGSGAFRDVFEHNMDADLVVKVETSEEVFQNIKEWDVWQTLCNHAPSSQWLAPCHYISPCGLILIQSKTQPITKAEMPLSVPKFFSDVKPDNWGRLKGKIVCHDYALVLPKYELKRKAVRC